MFAMFLSMKDFQFSSVLPWHRRDARFQLQKMRNHANNVNTLCTICYHFFNPYDFKSTMKAIELKKINWLSRKITQIFMLIWKQMRRHFENFMADNCTTINQMIYLIVQPLCQQGPFLLPTLLPSSHWDPETLSQRTDINGEPMTKQQKQSSNAKAYQRNDFL